MTQRSTAALYQTTVRSLLNAGYDTDEARATARMVIETVIGLDYAHLREPDREFNDDELDCLINIVHDLERGTPFAYIRGEREFHGLSFLCDERALIPRPETELLVDLAVERLRQLDAPLIADLGTGTGCIAASIGHALPHCVVYATDASFEALELARANARRNSVSSRIEFIRGRAGDWSQPLVAEGFAGQFNALFSNPPYIATAEIETLQPQVRDWEPRAALDGGADGLDCYRQIAEQCRVLLDPTGFLAVELGVNQFDAVRQIFHTAGWHIEAPLHDLADIARVLIAHQSAIPLSS